MTPEQYDHWKDFATRMARRCFNGRRQPGPRLILENVQRFFACLNEDEIACIVDWDNSKPFPEGSAFYRKTYRTTCWHCKGAKRDPKCPYNCEDRQIFDYARPLCMGDRITERYENWIPNYWSIADHRYDAAVDKWCGPMSCCIRAGLDMACAPSGGVLGFTAGDLRRMYPEGVPDWVTGGKKKRWQTIPIKGVVPGVGFVPGRAKLNGTFASMPDNAEIWL